MKYVFILRVTIYDVIWNTGMIRSVFYLFVSFLSPLKNKHIAIQMSTFTFPDKINAISRIYSELRLRGWGLIPIHTQLNNSL